MKTHADRRKHVQVYRDISEARITLQIRWPYWLTLIMAGNFAIPIAQAVPSFSRQTGHACSLCHVQAFGPNLTPYGREFKLKGYPLEKEDPEEKATLEFAERSESEFKISGFPTENWIPPVSAMVLGGFTNTQQDQQPPPAPGYNANNNFALNQISAFYAGHIYGKLGVFSQLTYNGVANTVNLDLTDVRYADRLEAMGQAIDYGISANNAPTVQDLWNTTPVWGFPYTTSPLAPTPSAKALIDGPLINTAGGGSIYAMISQMLYLDVGAYTTFSERMQKGLGVWSNNQLGIAGGAPYWRIALQHTWGNQYAQIGTYGLQANVYPNGVTGSGTNQYTDVAVDATYQYFGNMRHIFELKSTFIRELQGLSASRTLNLSSNNSGTLNTFRINGAYTFEQTYQLTFAYNQITGSSNLALYRPDAGYANSQPNSAYFIVEADYVPFGKATSLYDPWLNLRIGLQYIAYTKFNGTAYQAENNNTFFLSGWLSF
jgi:hypothetical protein